MTLMLVLPAVAAILLLRKYPPKTILWSALVQCVIVIMLANPIGKLLVYQLGYIANDLFDYIGYLLFCFGWIATATAGQYLVLHILKRFRT